MSTNKQVIGFSEKFRTKRDKASKMAMNATFVAHIYGEKQVLIFGAVYLSIKVYYI